MSRLQSIVMCPILAVLGSIRAADAQTTAGSILGEGSRVRRSTRSRQLGVKFTF